jgi:uncharacterized protein (TIGR03546 family)
MFFIFKTLHHLIKLLNSETAPSQLVAGIIFGLIVGFSPLLSLHNLFFLLLVFLFRVNLSMFFLSLGLFSLVSFALDPVFDAIGYWTLVDLKILRPFWIQISTGAVWPFFKFNNTIVIGSLVTSLAFVVPVSFVALRMIQLYRLKWRERIRDSRFVKALKMTPLYGLYEKYESAKSKLSAFS